MLGEAIPQPSAPRRGTRRVATTLAVATASVLVAACGSGSSGSSAGAAKQPDPSTVNLGYLVNFTHAPALIGVTQGYFQKAMPSGTTVKTTTFTSGTPESEALLGGTLDAAFVGPGPAINAFIKTKGKVLIVAGTASGGAGLVVSPAIASGNFPADLAGKTLSTPSLGNTQDIALRTWLSKHGLSSNVNGGGQVNIDTSSGNSVSLQNFEAGKIAGGWVPEPYESEFILQGHGTLAVDEASLWPGGQFPSTVLVVSQNLLQNHPDIVSDLLKGLVRSVNWINSNESTAPDTVNTALAATTGGKALKANVLALAWTHLSFTLDPLAADLQTSANEAEKLGFNSSSNIRGILDLGPLNAILKAAGDPTISAGSLGQ
ncbi:MAG TPA: ABC transporter substrate-binding protein [Candidatus Dormibacteraeota bacterium]